MAEGRFAGKVVMITGAAGGFGSAAARMFADMGASLLLSDVDKRALEKSVDGFPDDVKICLQQVDITNETDVAANIEHGDKFLGPIDIAINNAGIGQHLKPLHQTDTAEFDRIMAVNLRGVFLCMKHQLKGMVARKSGTILNVASAAGLVGAGHMAAYAASKHGVVGLTRSAADEVARHGIRVNALCPSFAPTSLFNEIADEVAQSRGTDRQAAQARITARIPMRRMAEIDEVVQAMAWICDPANSFMTGQAIAIDGGLTAV